MSSSKPVRLYRIGSLNSSSEANTPNSSSSYRNNHSTSSVDRRNRTSNNRDDYNDEYDRRRYTKTQTLYEEDEEEINKRNNKHYKNKNRNHFDDDEYYRPVDESRITRLGSDDGYNSSRRYDTVERYERLERPQRVQARNENGKPFVIRGTIKRVIEVTTTELDEINEFKVAQSVAESVPEPIRMESRTGLAYDIDSGRMSSKNQTIRIKSSKWQSSELQKMDPLEMKAQSPDYYGIPKLYKGERKPVVVRIRSSESIRPKKEKNKVVRLVGSEDEFESLEEKMDRMERLEQKERDADRYDKPELYKGERKPVVIRIKSSEQMKPKREKSNLIRLVGSDDEFGSLEDMERLEQRERAGDKYDRPELYKGERRPRVVRVRSNESIKMRREKSNLVKLYDNREEYEPLPYTDPLETNNFEEEYFYDVSKVLKEKPKKEDKSRVEKKEKKEKKKEKPSEFMKEEEPSVVLVREQPPPISRHRSRERLLVKQRADSPSPLANRDKQQAKPNENQQAPRYRRGDDNELIKIKPKREKHIESERVEPIKLRNKPDESEEPRKKPRDGSRFKSQSSDFQSDSFKLPPLVPPENKTKKKAASNERHNCNCERDSDIPSRRFYDPNYKRCPCLMHSRRYNEFGRPPPDQESYDTRPYSNREARPRHNHWYYHHPNYDIFYGHFQLFDSDKYLKKKQKIKEEGKYSSLISSIFDQDSSKKKEKKKKEKEVYIPFKTKLDPIDPLDRPNWEPLF